mgnify:FL=1|tara:strand:+ start:136 stop:1005 length:870 start_codon:yes stop_codon:yes gene_type:complete
MLNYFDREQKNAMISGGELRKTLEKYCAELCDKDAKRNLKNGYICGTAGFGKSHSVEQAAKNSGSPYAIIKGQASLFGMAQHLAVLKVKHWDEQVIIIIDDCDKLFIDADSINTMKELLGPSAMFTYSRNLYLNTIPEGAKRDAVEIFMNDESAGFAIDCSNFTFVVTSNNPLPSIKTVRTANAKLGDNPKTPRIEKLDHLHAIRTRVRYKMVDANIEDTWGSIAEIYLREDVLTERTEDEIKTMLNWMWYKREEMNEFNARTILGMSDDIDELGLEDALDRWSYNYIG